MWAKESTEEQLRDPEGFVTLDAKVLSAITKVLEGDFARQADSFKERDSNAGRPVRGRQVLFRLNDHFATNALHGSVYDLEDPLAIALANENLVVFLSNWETVLSGIQKAPDDTFLEPLFHRQVKKCKPLQCDINICERALDGSPEKTYKFLYDAARNHINRKRLERNRERIAKQTSGQPSVPAQKRIPKGFCVAFVEMAPATKGKHVSASTRYPSSAVVATHPTAEEDAHREVEPVAVPNQANKNASFTRLENVTEVTSADSSTRVSRVCQLRPTQGLAEVAEVGRETSVRKRRRRIANSPSLALEVPVAPEAPSLARDRKDRRAHAKVRNLLFLLLFAF